MEEAAFQRIEGEQVALRRHTGSCSVLGTLPPEGIVEIGSITVTGCRAGQEGSVLPKTEAPHFPRATPPARGGLRARAAHREVPL